MCWAPLLLSLVLFVEPATAATPPPSDEFAASSWPLEGRDDSRFRKLVVADLDGRGLDFRISGAVVLLEGGGGQLGLWNLAAQCEGVSKKEWEALIAAHFDAVLNRDEQDAERLAAFERGLDAVRPRLRASLWALEDLPDEVSDDMAFLPVAEGLSVLIAWDSEKSVTSLTRSALETIGLTPEEALQIALVNHATDPVAVEWMALPQAETVQVLMVETGDPYAATHALRLDAFRETGPPAGGWFVTVPRRSLLLAVPIEGADALSSLHLLVPMAREAYAEGPRPVTPEIYWLYEATWHPLQVATGQDNSPSITVPSAFAEMLEGLVPTEEDLSPSGE